MASWDPDLKYLHELAVCLKDTLAGHDRARRKRAEENLKRAQSEEDLWKYLTYLTITSSQPAGLNLSSGDWHTVRIAAAVTLKNNLKHGFRSESGSVVFLKTHIITGLHDEDRQIRNNVGSVITEVLRVGGVSAWPSLYAQLLSIASDQSTASSSLAQDGAMQALVKICEDHGEKLGREYAGSRPADVLVPSLLELLNSPNVRVRSSALASLNAFILEDVKIFQVRLDDFMNRLIVLAQDESSAVRRHVCKAFVSLIEVRPDLILAHLDGLIDYILVQQKNQEDDDLALEASDFWLSVSEHDQLSAALEPYLGQITPVLLDCMVYSEEDIMMHEIEEDDNADDKAEDLAPQFAKEKKGKTVAAMTNGDSTKEQSNGDGDALSDGEIVDSDNEAEIPEGTWNLRKCSAASLDSLAMVFHDRIFGYMLGHLQKNLGSPEWPNRESAVLALGAVGPGCMDAIVPHLPELIPYLIDLLNDPQPVVVQITCWTLGRYSVWICGQQDAQGRARYFEPMLERLLGRMLDKNKKTQEAAASSFALMLEQESSNLTDSVGPIVEQFIRCFGSYKAKNISLLYDCVATLSPWLALSPDKVDLTARLMKTIFDRWESLPEDSREIFALLECLGVVAINLYQDFAPYAQHIYTKIIRIVAQSLEVKIAANDNPDIDVPDKDFLVTCLDMISYLLQALGTTMSAQLLETTQPHLREILPYCLQDSELDVRQSAFALLGDVAIFVFDEIQRLLDQLMTIIVSQLEMLVKIQRHTAELSRVLNNICWAAGEILVRQPKGIERYAEALYQKFYTIMLEKGRMQAVHENSAIAMGRLGLVSAQVLAGHLTEFTPAFFQITQKLPPSGEKDTAFQGYCTALMLKPEAIGDRLPPLLVIIGIWSTDLTMISPQLFEICHQIISGYQQLVPNFSQVVGALPQEAQSILRRTYKVV